MKVGVISDVHSNADAFAVCVEYMEKEGCDEYLLLGDFVSDGPYPEETMQILYDLTKRHPCRLLRGNREDYLIGQRKVLRGEAEGPVWPEGSAAGNLLYTLRNLRDEDLDFLASLPISFVYEAEGYPAITCAHGSPDNTRQLLNFGRLVTHEWLRKIDTRYLLCAHTHFYGSETFEGRTILNSGSAGIAIGDPGLAQCLILRGTLRGGRKDWEPEFLKLPYPQERMIADIFDRGLYDMGHWFVNANIQTFTTGIDHASDLIGRVQEIAREREGRAEWPFLKEEYFEEAAGVFGIEEYAYLRKKVPPQAENPF